jgi:hypothetical protein
MRQRMMWHNPISFVNKFNFVNYTIKWKSINLHNTCTKDTQSASITCDKIIKKACHQKINKILLTYLLKPTNLPTHSYLPTHLPTTIRNCVREDHITLQVKFKNHSNTIVLQLHLRKCNSHTTTLYKYCVLITKFSSHEIS